MRHYYPYPGPLPDFVLERIELLLARLGQLGHQLRDTVARIIGTSVAEAVSAAIRKAMRWLPHRRAPATGTHEWTTDDTYGTDDPYGEVDPYSDEFATARDDHYRQRPPSAPGSELLSRWRVVLTKITRRTLMSIARHWSTTVARGALCCGMAATVVVFLVLRRHVPST